MSTLRLLLAALLAAITVAQKQSSQPYEDFQTGIKFQTYNAATIETNFSIALPAAGGKDFIGQISAPTRLGWAGMVLGSSMLGKLLLVSWPHDQNVVGTVRLASSKLYSPPEFPNVTLETIPKGTYSRSDRWQYTFLCRACLGTSESFDALSNEDTTFSWAASPIGVWNPSNKAASLPFHFSGNGNYRVLLSAARSDNFSAWSAQATARRL